MNPLLSRISIDPNVCFGKPRVRGTRICVSLLLDFLASGMSVEQILEEYPQLTIAESFRASVRLNVGDHAKGKTVHSGFSFLRISPRTCSFHPSRMIAGSFAPYFSCAAYSFVYS